VGKLRRGRGERVADGNKGRRVAVANGNGNEKEV
jgi:hypothetical protein